MTFQPRPGSTPQEAGREFEQFFARIFGVTPRKGSGNVWYAKLDVADGTILWSCKWTGGSSFRVSREFLRETVEAAAQDDAIPGMAIAVEGEVFVVLRVDDFLRIAQSDEGHVRPSSGQQKRRRAKTPSLFREEDP